MSITCQVIKLQGGKKIATYAGFQSKYEHFINRHRRC